MRVRTWPPNMFIVEYRIVNPMTIHVDLAVRVTVIQAVMILASLPTGLLPESLDIERVHFRRAILDLEQVAPLVDGGLRLQ